MFLMQVTTSSVRLVSCETGQLVWWVDSLFFLNSFKGCLFSYLLFSKKNTNKFLMRAISLFLFQFHRKKAYNKCCISLAVMLLCEWKMYLLNNMMWHDFLKCLGRLSLAFHQEALVYLNARVWKYYMYETTKGANNVYFVD